MTSSATNAESVPSFSVDTKEFETSHSLLDFVLEEFPLLFERLGKGLVGQGVAFQQDFAGPSRFHDAAIWWHQVVSNATISDEVKRPGTGLAALTRFAFSDSSTTQSSIIIPRVVIGSDSQGAWLTTVEEESSTPTAVSTAATTKSKAQWDNSRESEEHYVSSVGHALRTIARGELNKVVLARRLEGRSDSPLSVRAALTHLVDSYPDTHTFAIGSLLGASPETLASITNNLLSSRVLAGSASRGHDPQSDRAQAAMLAESEKDLDEHEYAVRSAEVSLRTLDIESLAIGQPRTIKLKNLWHVATDITASLPTTLTPLDVVGALHPTAAVAGTPRDKALRTIDDLEPFDRGYFAAPVGWIDSQGNGEFAIALRCAELSNDRLSVHAFAGAGIVHGSVAKSELAETTLKLQPIIEAF